MVALNALTLELTFFPVDVNRWTDLVQLFECRGGPHYCWCMVWRRMIPGKDRSKKTDKKTSLEALVKKGMPIGILGYKDQTPIAWCSVGPRNSFRNLGGDPGLSNVWSLVCFYVKREHRGETIAQKLLEEAIRYAQVNGADYLEASPVQSGSPSYRFMGFLSLFKRSGFKFSGKVGSRRHIVIKRLS